MSNLISNPSIDTVLFDSLVNLGEQSSHAYTILDASFQIIYQNDMHQLLTGFSFEDLHLRPFHSIIGNAKNAHYYAHFEEKMRNGTMFEMTLVHKKYEARSFSAKFTCIPMQMNQQTCYTLVLLEDITEKKIEQSIARLEHQFLNENHRSMHLIQKLEHICYELNTVMEPHCFATIAWFQNDLLAFFEADQVTNTPLQWLDQNDPRYTFYKNLSMANSYKVISPIAQSDLERKHVEYATSLNFEHAIAIPVKLLAKECTGVIVLYFDDLTRDTRPFHHYFEKLSELIAYNYNLDQQNISQCIPTFMDAGLQVPNRQGMRYFLEQKKPFLKEKELYVALLSPNEYFKVIELYGREVGELLLKEILNRIASCQQYEITLTGRFSSSSLFIVGSGPFDLDALEEHIQQKLATPFHFNGRLIYLTVKVGVAMHQLDDCIEETARRAEMALSKTRKQSGTSLGMYDEEYAVQIERELLLLNDLTYAIENKEIEVYVQPKIELHRGRIDSMEALARWISPTRGFISPADFIPVAEKNGLIHKIDLLMIEQVLAWMQQRQYEGKNIVPISVNISAEHFYHPDFVEQLIELVQKYYADPKYLIIEITETLGLEDLERAQKIITKLGLLNFTVSVDDFGIGYSSLSYLQKLKFRELKIDMSFVRRLDEVGTYAIVRAIIDIAKNLEMRVIAEGVETEAQAMKLKELGCDVAQGYLYYKPMPLQTFEF